MESQAQAKADSITERANGNLKIKVMALTCKS